MRLQWSRAVHQIPFLLFATAATTDPDRGVILCCVSDSCT